MKTSRLIRAPLWATLLVALVAAIVVSYFVFAPGGEAAPAADKPTYEPKIVNGTLVPDGKYPFMAFLWYTYRNGGNSWCGGSLIDQDSVLTAAHCVLGHGPPKNWKLQVFVGRTYLPSNQGQMRSYKSIWYHWGYKPQKKQNLAYDAAVINLSSAVSGIKPIELATSSQNKLESPGSRATAAGWGSTFPRPPGGKPHPFRVNRMREAQLPIFTDAIGQQFSPGYIPPLMIAAGGRKNGSGTCQGDSGGPLFRQVSGKYTQIGITSHAQGCAAAHPGVFTEVNNPSIRDFITRYAAK